VINVLHCASAHCTLLLLLLLLVVVTVHYLFAHIHPAIVIRSYRHPLHAQFP
jgi:hypothetical protein